MDDLRRSVRERILSSGSAAELGDVISDLLLRIERLEARPDPNEPPLIDGCRIVHRGDGFDVCKVHLRHWRAGSEMCPGRNAR